VRIGARTALATVIAVLVLVASWLGFFFYRDNFSTHYPIKVLSALSFRSGEIPYWNFADAGGQPLAGNPNTLTFYPDNILYCFLPAHVAFNLHFFLHLIAAFFVMRALTRSEFAAAMYALSGIAISAAAFYNLIVAVAMIPLAFLGASRRSPFLLGLAFGLLALAGEPVMIFGTALAVGILAIDRVPIRSWLLSIGICFMIASPQLIAYSEIAREVERSVAMSSRTVLNASLHPLRILELFVGPILGVLNSAGGPMRTRLFSTIFLGIIAVPALFRRSRYVLVAAVMLFFALGRFNPIVAGIVDAFPSVRIIRFPEKFALPMIVALVVLIAEYFRETRYKRVWTAITFIPLVATALWAIPIDFFQPYRRTAHAPARQYISTTIRAAAMPARTEYRMRALASEPLFGATEGVWYVIDPSPEGMHALRSRMVLERFDRATQRQRETYLRIMGCNLFDALPQAFFPSRAMVARDIYAEAETTERFADLQTVVTPRSVPVGPGRVVRYGWSGQAITIDVENPQTALLFVNQTYFSAWDARASGRLLDLIPVDIDRLGIIVPAGKSRIELRFGRHHAAVAVAWIVSSLALLGCALVEIRDRRAGEIQRPADEDRASV
jgi:hypothetical protein